MENRTLYLPGFHLATLRRKPRSVAQTLADEKKRIRDQSISQLGECFGQFIPARDLETGAKRCLQSPPFVQQREYVLGILLADS